MPIEALKCKVCNGNLDANLKCPYCGVQHERVLGKLQVCRVCPKHLLAYADSRCPQCEAERQAHLKYLEERRKEGLQKVNEAKLKYEDWKQRNFPKLKKLSIVALFCLIIGIAGLCVSTEVYMSSNVYKSASTGTNPASQYINVLSNNGVSYGEGANEITVSPTSNPNWSEFSVSLYQSSTLIETYQSGYGNAQEYPYVTIPFSTLTNGNTYSISISSMGNSATFTFVSTPSSTYPVAATPYTFNQALSIVSGTGLGVTEILLIVAGIGVPLCIVAEIWYESAEIGSVARLYGIENEVRT
jgi:hypothetical protein